MSETAQSTVKDFEEEIPAADSVHDAGVLGTTEGHAPISPKKKTDDGDVTTTEGHAPIAPPKAAND